MKLKNYLAMMAIALCAVACSDDDNKKEDTVIPAQEVLVLTMEHYHSQYQEMIKERQTVR